MNIQGFQKLTMLDFPGKTACTVFTGGCNLRCPFCHNVALVLAPDEEPFTHEEIYAYLEKRRGVLDGVAVTGGEPLLQKDIAGFLRPIKEMGFLIKLDTNGFFPEALGALLAEGLPDYVAMDVKNSKEKYARTCGRETLDLAPLERSMALLAASGIDYEYRTTVIGGFHTLADIEAICRWIRGAKRYYLQAFKDSGILKEGSGTPLPEEEMLAMRDLARTYIPVCELRGI
jgi:pyruvate formate lyase activating enzyme